MCVKVCVCGVWCLRVRCNGVGCFMVCVVYEVCVRVCGVEVRVYVSAMHIVCQVRSYTAFVIIFVIINLLYICVHFTASLFLWYFVMI